MNYNKINMKKSLFALMIIVSSLLCISCGFSVADLLNKKLELTPPIYVSYHTEYGKTPARKPVQKGDVITEEMLPEVAYKAKESGNNYYYIDGVRYYYDSEEEQTFDGWYYDEDYLEKVEVGDVIEDGLTLYAKWINTYVDISFSFNHGFIKSYYYYENNKEKNYTRQKIGTILSKDNLPIIDYDNAYYTFMGWYLDPYFETPAEGHVLESNITLYAKERYEGNCSIYYNTKSFYYSDMPESKGIQAGEYLTSDYLPELYPYPEHDNCEFMGWYYDYGCTRQAKVGDEVNSDITLYAKWVKKYARIFYSSGNTLSYADMPETKDVDINSTMLSDYLPNLTATSGYEEYVFVGWFYDWDCTREACIDDVITDDIWLYAKWEQKYVYISYWSNYSFAELPESRKIEKGSTLLLDYMPELSPPSGYEDYRFLGWYYDSESNAKAQVGDVIDINITLHAIWEAKYVTIYYSTLGYAQPVYEVMNVDRDSILTEELLPELTPYSSYDNLIFAGWYYDSYYESPASVGDILSGDNIWLYAKYDALPNGEFLEYWVFDEGVSLDYELWNGLTCVYNPTNSLTPAELQNDYFYAGEETIAYDSYSYDGVEYTNGNIVKRYYVNPLVSTNNLARLLSLIYVYDFTYDLIITDSNPDVEQIASILKNDNSKRCNINLNLCDNCNQLTSIPDNCFEGVTYLRMIFLPDSLQTIGKNAFKSCSGLSEMHIYPSVTLIDEGAFEDCSIAYVYYRGSVSDRENMIINDTTILNVAWFYNNY